MIIRLREAFFYTVEAVFKLVNTGETSTEWIGFPKWVVSKTGAFPEFARFEGSVNGKEIRFSPASELIGRAPLSPPTSFQERDIAGSRWKAEKQQWLVGRVTFPGRDSTTIRVTYEAPYSVSDGGFCQASYIYGTGHFWKGQIQQAIFVIDSTAVGGSDTISTYFEQGFGATTVSSEDRPVARPLLKDIVLYRLKDFKPSPEAYFRILLQIPSDYWGFKRYWLRRPSEQGARGPNLHEGPLPILPATGEGQRQNSR